MDSLLANYASSDEEDQQQQNHLRTSSSSIKPTSSSSLPNPKSIPFIHENNDPPKKLPLFSSIPKPKTQPQQPKPVSDSLNPSKRVVQFKPPVNPNYMKPADFDDEDDEMDRKRRKESQPNSQSSSSVKSFLSSIPAPKNCSVLGALPSATGSGRKSIIGVETTSDNSTSGLNNDQIRDSEDYVNHGGYESGISNVNDQEMAQYGSSGYESYHGHYYHDGQQYGNNWTDGSGTDTPEIAAGPSESSNLIIQGKKRGKNEIPTEIIEVNQAELTKNRPREDQAKLTGIAFGPSYQPTSTKGKPSKLHKRKHQIGSLYFDMKQKETELTERRAKGFLTKAQTQAKYGW